MSSDKGNHVKLLLKIINNPSNLISQLVIKYRWVSNTASNLAIIAETLSAIRYFVFLKINFNNSSLTRFTVVSKFFGSLNPNKVHNIYPFTIEIGMPYRAEYWNILFSIKLAKLLKVWRRFFLEFG